MLFFFTRFPFLALDAAEAFVNEMGVHFFFEFDSMLLVSKVSPCTELGDKEGSFSSISFSYSFDGEKGSSDKASSLSSIFAILLILVYDPLAHVNSSIQLKKLYSLKSFSAFRMASANVPDCWESLYAFFSLQISFF